MNFPSHEKGLTASDIIDQLNEGVLFIDNKRLVCYCNKALTRITGYELSELTGRHTSDIPWLAKYGSRLKDKIEQDCDEFPEKCEKEMTTKEGKKIWIRINSTKISGERKVFRGIFCLVTNITKCKKKERLKDQQISDTNAFIYRLTHDLKSPLASLTGLFALVHKQMKTDEIRPYFEMMELSIKHMHDLINDLTAIIETPNKKLSPEPIDFSQLIEELRPEFIHQAGFDKINFTTDISQKNIFTTDKKCILAIMRNLVNNAIKYRSEKNPFVNVFVSEDSKGVKLEVKDNGIGIPEKFHNKIFDMFFRGTEMSKGTGLGLYIVKTSVEKLYGKIILESNENSGTSITVLLPDLEQYQRTHLQSE